MGISCHCKISTEQNRSATVAQPAPGEGGVLCVPGRSSNQAFFCVGFVSVICAYLTLGLDHSSRRVENCSQAVVGKPAQLRPRVASKLFPR